ncbi:hypothetical protein SK128_022066, partial [Halocaridina rubra]
PARVSVGLLVASGVMMLYMLRVNLSVAIVAMVHIPSTSSPNGAFEEDKAYCQEVNTTAASSDGTSNPPTREMFRNSSLLHIDEEHVRRISFVV